MPDKIIKASPGVSMVPAGGSAARHLASFVPRGIARLKTHYYVMLRHFAKEYKVPLIVTVVFLVLIAAAILFRAAQQSSLANLLAGVTTIGQDYGTLVSEDKADALRRNADNSQGGATTAPVPVGSPTSLTINTGTSTGSGGGSSSGSGTSPSPSPSPTPSPSPSPATTFAASIAYFKQDSATLECLNNKPKALTCSKRYIFSAGIRTQNGPGSVNYGWRSNWASAVQDATISVGSGEVLTNVQKEVFIECSTVTNFSLQIVIASPTLTQSAVINTVHDCGLQ